LIFLSSRTTKQSADDVATEPDGSTSVLTLVAAAVLNAFLMVALARPVCAKCSATAASRTASAAAREITPREPVYLGGYGFGPTRRSTGVHDRLYARALVIDGSATVVFGAIDTQGISSPTRIRPAARPRRLTALPISATVSLTIAASRRAT
jgi:hypothetical protein